MYAVVGDFANAGITLDAQYSIFSSAICNLGGLLHIYVGCFFVMGCNQYTKFNHIFSHVDTVIPISYVSFATKYVFLPVARA